MGMTATEFFTELTGVGALSTHAGFNVCTYTGCTDVAADMALLAERTGIDTSRMVFPRQTHTANVAVVRSLPAGPLANTDAVVTDLPGVLLGVNTADCAPLLMADVSAGVIAACHCGWRGTVAGIAAATLRAMESLGAERGRVRAVIGPCICPECFEVGEEVAERFPAEAVIRAPGAKPRVDLPRAVALQLPGVKVELSGLCSRHNTDFYSVRRQGYGLTSRTLSAIWLTKD